MAVVTVKPSSGGQLITRATSSEAGTANYVVKRNFRRDLDAEIRREGWDIWMPFFAESDAQTQPYPAGSNDTIGLVHLCRRPDGESAATTATPTTIYRLNDDLGLYVLPYSSQPYVNQYAGQDYVDGNIRWSIIGAGFAPGGNRWEAINSNGTTLYNNGYDLPVAYDLNAVYSRPLYELREQGILSIGTIAEHQSIALCADIRELANDTDTEAVLGLLTSGGVTVAQTGRRASVAITATVPGGGSSATLTASAAFFSGADVDRIVVFTSTGQRLNITAYTNSTHVTVTPVDAGTITAVSVSTPFWVSDLPDLTTDANNAYALTSSGPFFTNDMVGTTLGWPDGSVRLVVRVTSSTLAHTSYDAPITGDTVWYNNPNAYAAYNPLTNSVGTIALTETPNRRQTRLIWSMPGLPERFASQIPVECDVCSDVLVTRRQIGSLKVGQAIAVVGGAANGGTLITDPSGKPITIRSIIPGRVQISTIAPVTNTGAFLIAADAIGSIIGYSDLDDDGSGILKMLTLLTTLVIYKDTSIFLAQYTGDSTQPFVFTLLKVPHDQTLHFRNTLANVGGLQHVYVGRNNFYSFNLTNQIPQMITQADMIQDLFFNYATIDHAEKIFVADNPVTKELWFVCPQNTTDPVLAFDYRYRTFSTHDVPITAAGVIKGPIGNTVGSTDDYFIAGNNAGTLLVYGATNGELAQWGNGSQIFYRRMGRPYSATVTGAYTSTIRSGLGDFGDEYNEKHIRSWVIQFTSQQATPATFTVNFYTAKNQDMAPMLLGSRVVTNAELRGLVPIHALFHNFADEVIVSGYGNPIRLHSRIYELAGVTSQSNTRR